MDAHLVPTRTYPADPIQRTCTYIYTFQLYEQGYREKLKHIEDLPSIVEYFPYSDTLKIDKGFLMLKDNPTLQPPPALVPPSEGAGKRPTPKPKALNLEADADEMCARLEAIVRECGGRVAVTTNALHRVRGPAWGWFDGWARAWPVSDSRGSIHCLFLDPLFP
jgi:hypothetical protein